MNFAAVSGLNKVPSVQCQSTIQQFNISLAFIMTRAIQNENYRFEILLNDINLFTE